MSGTKVYEGGKQVAEKIRELVDLLEVADIIALIVVERSGGLGVIGPSVETDILDAIGDGAREALLARGLAKTI